MHIRRQLREAIATTLQQADPDIRVLTTHRLEVATGLVEQGHQVVMVFPVGEPEAQRINSAVQGARPTYRTFEYGVCLVVSDDDADSGLLDDLSVTVECALFANESPVRAIATRDVKLVGGEVNVIDSVNPAVALPYIFQLTVPMLEGEPDRGY